MYAKVLKCISIFSVVPSHATVVSKTSVKSTLLSKSEIYNPRRALVLASLPNLKYKFPKWNCKIHKK